MSFRSDLTKPDYINNAAVTNGTTLVGDKVILYGAQGLSLQIIATNGAAGSLIIEGTNQFGVNATYGAAQTIAVSANGTAFASFALSDQLLVMHAIRCRFVPSASGNLSVAYNIRRPTTA